MCTVVRPHGLSADVCWSSVVVYTSPIPTCRTSGAGMRYRRNRKDEARQRFSFTRPGHPVGAAGLHCDWFHRLEPPSEEPFCPWKYLARSKPSSIRGGSIFSDLVLTVVAGEQ